MIWRERVLSSLSLMVKTAFVTVVMAARENVETVGPEAFNVLGLIVESYLMLGNSINGVNPDDFYKVGTFIE